MSIEKRLKELDKEISDGIDEVLPQLIEEFDFVLSKCGLLADLGFPRDRMRRLHLKHTKGMLNHKALAKHGVH